MFEIVHQIDYSNFKDAVAEKQSGQRAATYGRVWSALLSIESETFISVEREDGPSYRVFRYANGLRAESCRLHYADGEGIDSLKGGIELELNTLSNKWPVTAFVQGEGDSKPECAYWRSKGRNKGPYKELRFCPQCPHPIACGHIERGCRLSKSGNPETAFTPKMRGASIGYAHGFEGPINAQNHGQVWLNDVNTVFGLLMDLQLRTFEIWCKWSCKEYLESEAEFREQLEIEWLAAIFRGKNPKFAVLDWNTDPKQLPSHIINAFYIGQGNAESEADGPPLDRAIEGLLDCVSAFVRFRVRDIAYGEPGASLDEFESEVAKNAADHIRFLLGLPFSVDISPDFGDRQRPDPTLVPVARVKGDEDSVKPDSPTK